MDFKTVSAGGEDTYLDVAFGEPRQVDTILVDVSTLTPDFVDSYGWLKPGTMLQADGTIISGAGQIVYGVVPNVTRLRGRTDNTGLGADTRDQFAAVLTGGSVQRKAIEKNLGRVLSANELAAFAAGGCKIALTN